MLLKNWPFHGVNRSKTAFDKDSAKISTFFSRRFNYSALAGYYNGYAAEGPMLKFRVKFAVEDTENDNLLKPFWQWIEDFSTQEFLHSKKQKRIKAITPMLMYWWILNI